MPDFADTLIIDDSHQPLRPPALQVRGKRPAPIPFPAKPMARSEAADLARHRNIQQAKRDREEHERLALARSEGFAAGLKHGLAGARAGWFWGAGTGAAIGGALALLIPHLIG